MEPVDVMISNFNEPYNNRQTHEEAVDRLRGTIQNSGLQYTVPQEFPLHSKVFFFGSVLVAFATQSPSTLPIFDAYMQYRQKRLMLMQLRGTETNGITTKQVEFIFLDHEKKQNVVLRRSTQTEIKNALAQHGITIDFKKAKVTNIVYKLEPSADGQNSQILLKFNDPVEGIEITSDRQNIVQNPLIKLDLSENGLRKYKIDDTSFYPDPDGETIERNAEIKTPKFIEMVIDLVNTYFPKAKISIDSENFAHFLMGASCSVKTRFNMISIPRFVYRPTYQRQQIYRPPYHRQQISDVTLSTNQRKRNGDTKATLIDLSSGALEPKQRFFLPDSFSDAEPYLSKISFDENTAKVLSFNLHRPKRESIFSSLMAIAKENPNMKESIFAVHINRLVSEREDFGKLTPYFMGQLKATDGPENSRHFKISKFKYNIDGRTIDVHTFFFANSHSNEQRCIAVCLVETPMPPGTSLLDLKLENDLRVTAWTLGAEVLDRYYVEIMVEKDTIPLTRRSYSKLSYLSYQIGFTKPLGSKTPLIYTNKNPEHINEEKISLVTKQDPKLFKYLESNAEVVLPNVKSSTGEYFIFTKLPNLFKFRDAEDYQVLTQSVLSCSERKVINIESLPYDGWIDVNEPDVTLHAHVASSSDNNQKQKIFDSYQKRVTKKRQRPSHTITSGQYDSEIANKIPKQFDTGLLNFKNPNAAPINNVPAVADFDDMNRAEIMDALTQNFMKAANNDPKTLFSNRLGILKNEQGFSFSDIRHLSSNMKSSYLGGITSSIATKSTSTVDIFKAFIVKEKSRLLYIPIFEIKQQNANFKLKPIIFAFSLMPSETANFGLNGYRQNEIGDALAALKIKFDFKKNEAYFVTYKLVKDINGKDKIIFGTHKNSFKKTSGAENEHRNYMFELDLEKLRSYQFDKDSFLPRTTYNQAAAGSLFVPENNILSPYYIDVMLDIANEYLPKADIECTPETLAHFIQGGDASVRERYGAKTVARFSKMFQDRRPRVKDLTLVPKQLDKSSTPTMVDLFNGKDLFQDESSHKFFLPATVIADLKSESFCYTGIKVNSDPTNNGPFIISSNDLLKVQQHPLFTELMQLFDEDGIAARAAVFSSHIDRVVVESDLENIPRYLSEQLVKSGVGIDVQTSIYTWKFQNQINQQLVTVKSFILIATTTDNIKKGIVITFTDNKDQILIDLDLEVGMHKMMKNKVDIFDTYFIELAISKVNDGLATNEYKKLNILFRLAEPEKFHTFMVYTKSSLTDFDEELSEQPMKMKGYTLVSLEGESAKIIPKIQPLHSNSEVRADNSDSTIQHVEHHFKVVVSGEDDKVQYSLVEDSRQRQSLGEINSEIINLILEYMKPADEVAANKVASTGDSLDPVESFRETPLSSAQHIGDTFDGKDTSGGTDLSFIDDLLHQGEQDLKLDATKVSRQHSPKIDFDESYLHQQANLMITEANEDDNDINTFMCFDI